MCEGAQIGNESMNVHLDAPFIASSTPTSMVSPLRNFKPEKGNSKKLNPNWFETTTYSGPMILGVIRDATSTAPIPYLRQSASMLINIIDIIQV